MRVHDGADHGKDHADRPSPDRSAEQGEAGEQEDDAEDQMDTPRWWHRTEVVDVARCFGSHGRGETIELGLSSARNLALFTRLG